MSLATIRGMRGNASPSAVRPHRLLRRGGRCCRFASMNRLPYVIALFAGLCAPVRSLAAQATPAERAPLQSLLARQFQGQLDSLASVGPGVIGVAIEDLTSGE